MKRATGKTDTPQPGYKVSIQQSLDGHSFSVAAPPAFPAEAERIEAEVLTPRTMLVPVEYFAGERAAALLAANGMPALSGEETVCSDAEEEIVAVMALSGEALRQAAEAAGGRPLRFTTPLLHRPAADENTVWLCRRAGLLYIKVYDDGRLRAAEVVAAADEAELRYLAERLDAVFPLRGYTLLAAGDDPKTLRKLLGKRFRKVVCE